MKLVNLDRVTIISIGFTLLFIAFNSAANLSAQTMSNLGYGGLGFYTMAVLYLVFAFTSFFSTAIVNKIGTKASLIFGGLCYFFWVFCFLAPAFSDEKKGSAFFLFNKGFIYFLSLFSAAVNGLGAGILWVAQGKYVAECASDENKGFFFSFFWAFFMASQIIGNLIAGLILGNMKLSFYYLIMSGAALAGTCIFLVLRKPIKHEIVNLNAEGNGGVSSDEHLQDNHDN